MSSACDVRIKLDENMPAEAVGILRSAGHDVHTVLDERLQGQPDTVVAQHMAVEGRALITLDRGFGDMRKYPPSHYAGILVLRPVSQDKPTVLSMVETLLPILDIGNPTGHLWIVEPDRVRVRPA